MNESLYNSNPNIVNSPNKPSEIGYEHAPQYSFRQDHRITSGLLLFPSIAVLGYTIARTVELDRDYDNFWAFIPKAWLIILPLFITHITYSVGLAWTYPFNSQLITKFWTPKTTLIPDKSPNQFLLFLKRIIFIFSFVLQGLIASGCCAMAIGNFIGETIDESPSSDSSWLLFWLYFILTIVFLLTTTLTGFSIVELYRSESQRKKYYSESREESININDLQYLPPNVDAV